MSSIANTTLFRNVHLPKQGVTSRSTHVEPPDQPAFKRVLEIGLLIELHHTQAGTRTCQQHLHLQSRKGVVWFVDGKHTLRQTCLCQAASPITPALVTKTNSKCSRLDRRNSNRHQTPQHGSPCLFGRKCQETGKSARMTSTYEYIQVIQVHTSTLQLNPFVTCWSSHL